MKEVLSGFLAPLAGRVGSWLAGLRGGDRNEVVQVVERTRQVTTTVTDRTVIRKRDGSAGRKGRNRKGDPELPHASSSRRQ